LGLRRFSLVFNRCQLRDNYFGYFWNSELFKDMETRRKKPLRFGVNEYRLPTPTKFRRLGDGLLLASTIIGTTNIDSPVLATVVIVFGTVGKFLTNFFSQ
jgi:hypothetical protein